MKTENVKDRILCQFINTNLNLPNCSDIFQSADYDDTMYGSRSIKFLRKSLCRRKYIVILIPELISYFALLF